MSQHRPSTYANVLFTGPQGPTRHTGTRELGANKYTVPQRSVASHHEHGMHALLASHGSCTCFILAIGHVIAIADMYFASTVRVTFVWTLVLAGLVHAELAQI